MHIFGILNEIGSILGCFIFIFLAYKAGESVNNFFKEKPERLKFLGKKLIKPIGILCLWLFFNSIFPEPDRSNNSYHGLWSISLATVSGISLVGFGYTFGFAIHDTIKLKDK